MLFRSKIDESFKSDLSHPESLDNHGSDFLSEQLQDVPVIDPSQLVNPREPKLLGTELDQTNGCSDHSLSENIFNHTADDRHSDLLADPMKTPKFEDSLSEDSSTRQKIKTL